MKSMRLNKMCGIFQISYWFLLFRVCTSFLWVFNSRLRKKILTLHIINRLLIKYRSALYSISNLVNEVMITATRILITINAIVCRKSFQRY